MKHAQVKLHPKITLKKNIYILHKENGAHFQTIFSQKLSIFFLLLVKYLTFTLFFVFIQILNSILTITV